jgi:hypothetical protein
MANGREQCSLSSPEPSADPGQNRTDYCIPGAEALLCKISQAVSAETYPTLRVPATHSAMVSAVTWDRSEGQCEVR